MKNFILFLCIFINLISYSQSTPTIQASNITFTNITHNSFSVSCTKGDGSKRIIFVKEGKNKNSTPNDNNTYTANSIFGLGSLIDKDWYCVYNGTDTTTTITGLISKKNIQSTYM